MKSKRTIGVLLIFLSLCSGTFITIKVKQFINEYKEEHTFTKEKWVAEPSERISIRRDMLNKYNFIGMTKEEVIGLLGEPETLRGEGMRIYTSSPYKDTVKNSNSSIIHYLISSGDTQLDVNGFYLMFDGSNKVIDYGRVHFSM